MALHGIPDYQTEFFERLPLGHDGMTQSCGDITPSTSSSKTSNMTSLMRMKLLI